MPANTPPAVCCELWPACDCDIEALDLDDEDALWVIRGKAVTYDEYYKFHFGPEPRK